MCMNADFQLSNKIVRMEPKQHSHRNHENITIAKGGNLSLGRLSRSRKHAGKLHAETDRDKNRQLTKNSEQNTY